MTNGTDATFAKDGDQTGQLVPLRKLPRGLMFSWLPLRNLVFGDENLPVEVVSLVSNGSIVVGVGSKDKRYYVVRTVDIIYAACQADRLTRSSGSQSEVKR